MRAEDIIFLLLIRKTAQPVHHYLGDGDELSHRGAPLFFDSYPKDERVARLPTQSDKYFYEPELLPGRRFTSV
jgi:hypothetical protein